MTPTEASTYWTRLDSGSLHSSVVCRPAASPPLDESTNSMALPATSEPTLLFLHGVGAGDMDNLWQKQLVDSLTSIGYPGLDGVQVVAPKYAHALRGFDVPVALAALTIKSVNRDAARQNRRDFERRTGAIEFRLGRQKRSGALLGNDHLFAAALDTDWFAQARNYLRTPEIRAQVLHRILAALPQSGRLIIVGHSLGSVIAADLLRRLPVGLEVAGLVTIGSPLADGNFNVDKLRDQLAEPPTNLSWWLNFQNALDPVASKRGVSSVFPWMIDFRIDTKAPVQAAHAAVQYLGDPIVAEAIGFAVFGSQSKELSLIDQGVDIPLDDAERLALLALRYTHLLKATLTGDLRDRFTGAVRHVQATLVEDIKRRNLVENRGVPTAIAGLAFDLSDPNAVAPEPQPAPRMSKEDALIPLTVLAAENVLRPFEITVPKDQWQSAMRDLSAEMGLGSRFGDDVFAAAREASEALSSGNGMTWVKWGAFGVGAAALIFATGGLILAAGAGLAGAAAITSALAAFGPGGMIGGLVTAGTLVGAGGGGIAFGLASSGTTAETLEAVIERRLASVILRKKQGLEPDSDVWTILTETEVEVRREHERLDEFSDPSSPALKELKRKITTVERALKYLTENGLEPGVVIEEAVEVAPSARPGLLGFLPRG